ncbi:MAG: hypothetical protein V5A64_04420 [Candidatus Thermoplasmatota archaeon]
MDVLAIAIGFSIGVIVIAIAIELGMKKTSRSPPASKPADNWSISEITNPRIMAEYLIEGDLPEGSKLVVNQCKDENLLKGLNARKHSKVRGNYIIGDERVLILSGPIKKDVMGVWTVEKEIVDRLNKEFNEMWRNGKTIKPKEE